MAVDFTQAIKDLRSTMASVREVTDLTALQAQITELESKAAEPTLWDDPEKAKPVLKARGLPKQSTCHRPPAEHRAKRAVSSALPDIVTLRSRFACVPATWGVART